MMCEVQPSIRHLPHHVLQLVQQTITTRRMEREANPEVFRRYAKTLLKTLPQEM